MAVMTGAAGSARFRTTTVPLSLALASRCPSGENARAETPRGLPARSRWRCA